MYNVGSSLTRAISMYVTKKKPNCEQVKNTSTRGFNTLFIYAQLI